MSQERVDPASWQICQDLNRVNKQNATLLTEIQEWGAALTRVGNALSGHPDAIAQVDLTGLPSFRELHRAVQEIIALRTKLNSLRAMAEKVDIPDPYKRGDSIVDPCKILPR